MDAFVFDRFLLRLSNQPFSLAPASLEEYERHFTVMNYRPGAVRRGAMGMS